MADLYPRSELDRLLGQIRRQAAGRFDGLLNTAETCKWRPKPAWFPFQYACTTLGETVYLSKAFIKDYPDWSRCALILHEATHVQQWRMMGRIKFALMYAVPSKRLTFEQAGVRAEFFWAIATRRLENPDNHTDHMGYIRENPLIQRAIKSLMENYFMDVDHETLNRWALAVVREGFRMGMAP